MNRKHIERELLRLVAKLEGMGYHVEAMEHGQWKEEPGEYDSYDEAETKARREHEDGDWRVVAY